MTITEIICIIGIALVMFILGRRTKRTSFPIVGEFEFRDEKPCITFKTDLKNIAQFKYVVFKIRGRINDDNERRSM